jgi:hypothetical protein
MPGIVVEGQGGRGFGRVWIAAKIWEISRIGLPAGVSRHRGTDVRCPVGGVQQLMATGGTLDSTSRKMSGSLSCARSRMRCVWLLIRSTLDCVRARRRRRCLSTDMASELRVRRPRPRFPNFPSQNVTNWEFGSGAMWAERTRKTPHWYRDIVYRESMAGFLISVPALGCAKFALDPASWALYPGARDAIFSDLSERLAPRTGTPSRRDIFASSRELLPPHLTHRDFVNRTFGSSQFRWCVAVVLCAIGRFTANPIHTITFLLGQCCSYSTGSTLAIARVLEV